MRRHPGYTTVLIMLMGALLCGCSAIPIDSPHLNIDKDGYVADATGRPIDKSPKPNELTAEEKAVALLMDRLSAQVAQDCARPGNSRAHLMLFVHGGLVTTRSAMASSAELDESAVFSDRDIHPIYINWNSGLASAIADDIFWIRGGQRLREGVFLFPAIIVSRFATGLFNAPPNWYYQAVDESRFLQKWPDEPQPSFGEILGDAAIGLVHAPISIASTPFFTGFGRGAWEMMNRRIDLMFAVQKAPKRFARRDDVHPGVMRTFLDALAETRKAWAMNPETATCDIKLDFTGHSMGTLIGTRILREYPDIRFDRILFLAPASTVEDYVTTVPVYLERHPDSKFYSFGLSVIDEGNELSFRSFVLPRGSLLVWIDNYFDPIYSPEDYRLGDNFNRTTFRAPLNATDARCERMRMLKVAGPRDGRDDMPRKHGEFNDPEFLARILDITGDAPGDPELKFACTGECVAYNPCRPPPDSE